MESIIWLVVGAIVGIAVGFIVTKYLANSSTKRAAEEAHNVVEDAKRQADTLRREAVVEAKDEALRLRQEAQAENKERLKEVRAAEQRVNQREESLDRRVESLDSREQSLDSREHQISSMQGQLERRQRDLDASEQEIGMRLQQVAGMTADEAKTELLDTLKDEVAHESAAIIRDSEARTKAEADKKARSILSLAIQRVAADHTAETTVSAIHIPSDDLKGRIIGREGRNIRSFEQLTGTNLIIDDTPECVTISCFDPVRREIGRVTMENLIADGRIHPARIEEMFGKAEKLVNQRVQEAGEQAAFDTGIHDLHPELVRTLGRLRYRTSYGQNVLNHSLEVAYLSGVMASELGLDPVPAKRAGLLHDLGKAVDHEVEGSHAVIGADLARRFGEKPSIVHAIEAHHNDVEPNSVLDVLVQAADAVSAARPGARKETLDAYIKRLEKLEEIANSYKGVERTYAIQAGREVRVMVEPDVVDEAQTTVLAHDIAKRIEDEMQYPGQVKVVVIRESRAIGIAK
ncbi:ribonuclease Y [uncultured Senegalimassilia sp.]|uniref:ribonuclease Y n=1 Tax=uncultured Senegalimassilia sp. TaxID=1714350 RepID=UPI00258CCF26|nr:ribonuclease Y [uncultured Senegalimassilia sp.]